MMIKTKRREQNPIEAQHRANILKNLDHRLEVARSKGKTDLIEKLQAEKEYYNLA